MWSVAVTHTRTTMITQVLELVLLSQLYHSCALKSVRKIFLWLFICVCIWLTRNRQRFHNKAVMEDLILPPPKAMALSPNVSESWTAPQVPGKWGRKSLLAEDLPKEEQHLTSQCSSLQGQEAQPDPFLHCTCHYSVNGKDNRRTSGSVV